MPAVNSRGNIVDENRFSDQSLNMENGDQNIPVDRVILRKSATTGQLIPPLMAAHPTRRSFTSSFMRIPEDREIDIVCPCPASKQDLNIATIKNDQTSSILVFWRSPIGSLILWWPTLIITLSLNLMRRILQIVMFLPLLIAAPSFWLSALLWIFWKVMRIPISILKWVLSSTAEDLIGNNNTTSAANRSDKRTVLISCGSTIQTLHLARNLYSSGARVIVFEFEGHFGLARFSTAVHKFYSVPKPTADNPDSYIAALCNIVDKEKPSYYVPVCATSPAYYDALAKPHLELLGCATFLPNLQESVVIDDSLKFFQKCRASGIPLPPYKILSSKEDLMLLYESGFIAAFRNIMMAVGMQGLLERFKYVVPNNRRDFKFSHEISEKSPWLIVRDIPGDHYVTCTTVKDSKVIANASCVVEPDTKNLIPRYSKGIEIWIKEFFAKTRSQRPINGHISFRLVKSQATGEFLPLGARVGVSLPYICYSGTHAKVLCKPCSHNNQTHSLLDDAGLFWSNENHKTSSIDAISRRLLGNILDKREALFAYWDPLPYCAYYHFQLPLASVRTFLQNRQKTTTPQTIPAAIASPVN
ncbi:uncharacterized protein LOC129913115 [Episyrphus balteatus]|uniref:uncharacterized protein LOC129913115 n=1 Tax=Episyrphus balteatus TaxID=286459 RepID=UPI002485EE32|nr:uncharacterized protein LOC129913115 [Episyrphus balteatus]